MASLYRVSPVLGNPKLLGRRIACRFIGRQPERLRQKVASTRRHSVSPYNCLESREGEMHSAVADRRYRTKAAARIVTSVNYGRFEVHGRDSWGNSL